MKDEDRVVRFEAARALRRIDPEGKIIKFDMTE
ncbi:MAG TPA: hypothetical protein PK601_02800 [Methanothermobacter sp.]|nr:hypothetical protein [Methanothermobacter sp.]